MKWMLCVCVLFAAGCVTPGEKQDTTKPTNSQIREAVTKAVANCIENDGGLETPIIGSTSDVTAYLMMAFELQVGNEDVFDDDWWSRYDAGFESRFEPNGESEELDPVTRSAVVEYLLSLEGDHGG